MRTTQRLAGLAAALLLAAGLPALAQTDNTTGNNASHDRTGSTSDKTHGTSSTSSSSTNSGTTWSSSGTNSGTGSDTTMAKNASCQEVARQQQDLQREMRADDDHMATLVAQMNSATGDARTQAMAAVINELVAQRRTLRQRMMAVNQATLRHVAMHAAQGGSMASAMMNCPAMQGMTSGTDTYRTGSTGTTPGTQGTQGTTGNDNTWRGKEPGTDSGTRKPDTDRDSSRMPSDSPRVR